MIKKILSLSLILGSAALFAPEAKAADSKAGSAVEASQMQQDRYYRRSRVNRRGVRVVNRTRIVRRGFATYREVWQYRYLPNGRVNQRLISRTRIR